MKAALGFVKIAIGVLPEKELASHVEDLVRSVPNFSPYSTLTPILPLLPSSLVSYTLSSGVHHPELGREHQEPLQTEGQGDPGETH